MITYQIGDRVDVRREALARDAPRAGHETRHGDRL